MGHFLHMHAAPEAKSKASTYLTKQDCLIEAAITAGSILKDLLQPLHSITRTLKLCSLVNRSKAILSTRPETFLNILRHQP